MTSQKRSVRILLEGEVSGLPEGPKRRTSTLHVVTNVANLQRTRPYDIPSGLFDVSFSYLG